MRRQPKDQRIFHVSAMKRGFVVTKGPGRLYVSDYAITLSTTFREITCLKPEITDISLERLFPNFQLLFEDESGKLADVAVVLVMRVKGVLGELRRRGYPIVDRRGPILPVFLPQDTVPRPDPETEEGDEPPASGIGSAN
jgi:hypothetical protein